MIAKKLFLEERYKTGREIKSAHDRELSKECFRARGINFYLSLKGVCESRSQWVYMTVFSFYCCSGMVVAGGDFIGMKSMLA